MVLRERLQAVVRRMTWRDSARDTIAEIMRDVPATATLAERKRILRIHTPSRYDTKIWRQMWYEERRKYLEAHGQPKRAPKGQGALFPGLFKS